MEVSPHIVVVVHKSDVSHGMQRPTTAVLYTLCSLLVPLPCISAALPRVHPLSRKAVL